MYNYGGIIKYLIGFVVISSFLHLAEEPFLSSDEPFLRHEIRLLKDQGNLEGTINSWPFYLGGLIISDDQLDRGYDLLADTITRESRSGFSPLPSSIGFSDNRTISRSFGNEPRGGFTIGLETSWMNDRFAAKLALLALHKVENDWKNIKVDGVALDCSYLTAGDLNEDYFKNNFLSIGLASDYLAIEVFNSRSYKRSNLEAETSLGEEV